jgi:4-coumarate--CoA ligase
LNGSAHQITTSQASVIVSSSTTFEAARTAAKEVGISEDKVFVLEDDAGVKNSVRALMGDEEYEPVVFDGDEAKDQVALMCFSSGTTGPPKGVESSESSRHIST